VFQRSYPHCSDIGLWLLKKVMKCGLQICRHELSKLINQMLPPSANKLSCYSVLRMLSSSYSDAQAADNLLTAAQYKATEETTSYLN